MIGVVDLTGSDSDESEAPDDNNMVIDIDDASDEDYVPETPEEAPATPMEGPGTPVDGPQTPDNIIVHCLVAHGVLVRRLQEELGNEGDVGNAREVIAEIRNVIDRLEDALA